MKQTLLFICLVGAATTMWAKGLKPTKQLADEFIRSEMTRSEQAWALEGAVRPKWTYTIGLEVGAFVQFQHRWEGCSLTEKEVYDYARTYTDVLISEEGKIEGYKKENYKLDDINSGKLVMMLYEKTHETRYKTVMDSLFSQLLSQPRTPEGGYWHKQIYPQQMWLDGLYMAEPFKAKYARDYVEGNIRWEYYDDIIHQFALCYEMTLCPDCHLPHHAWDSAHQQNWCDPSTGRSSHAWGRAIGWYMMALVDTYEIIYGDNPNHDHSDSLSIIINRIGEELLKRQDRRNGCWQQVIDETGREGNYFEMSATPMIAYSFLKGYRLGMLPKKYASSAKKALKGMCRYFVKKDEQTGRLTLTNICSVAGLSNDRDGSYEYYLREPIRENDPKGVGPFILALMEN